MANKNYYKRKRRMPNFKQLTQQISFVDVLGHYNLLEQITSSGSGEDQLRGVCPLPAHPGAKNKTSFSVNTEKNCFHCFSCEASGDIITFVAAMEGCKLYKAGCLLEQWFSVSANKGGGDTDQTSRSRPPQKTVLVQEKKNSDDSAGTSEMQRSGAPIAAAKDEKLPAPAEGGRHDEANPILTFALKNLDLAHPYLLSRVQAETIERFGLGFCTKGLMKGRAVIPIHNAQGEVVAYAGRAVEEEPEIKYKFPPSFKKGYELFNFHRVVEALRRGDPLILVEGFFDVFRLYELGYHNALALMGSELTVKQEELLKSILTPRSLVALMFDNDQAGQACCENVAVRLMKRCFIKVVDLPEGINQPDELQSKIEIF